MKVTNKSNYPKVVNGVRIEPGATESVDFDGRDLQQFKDDGDLELEDDSAPSTGETGDEPEEISKPEEKIEEKEGEE